MKIENEVLYATSDGFYYDGVPSKGSYTSSSAKTEKTILEKDQEVIFEQIGSTVIIIQILIISLAVISILKGVLNSMNNKKIVGGENNLSDKNTKIKSTTPYYIFSIILFVIYGVTNIIKGFIINFL